MHKRYMNEGVHDASCESSEVEAEAEAGPLLPYLRL